MTDTAYATEVVTFENFDPNKQFARKPMWGVFDGHKFKSYSQRGHAINSVHHHGRAKLYELTPTGWVLRATKDERNKPELCQHCGGTTMGHRTHARYSSYRYNEVADPDVTNLGEFVFQTRGRKYIEPIEMLFVCKDCVPATHS